MKRNQSGFTLIEIAIVLVIIGLLLGGVMKGQELINSAKVKNLAGDFKNVPLFIYSYQDKYRALPGDDLNSVNHVSGVAATTPVLADVGNGLINGNWDSLTVTDESVKFWQQIRLAGLAAGPTVLPASITSQADPFLQQNSVGGRVGIESGSTTPPITNLKGAYIVCSMHILGKFAKQLDTTMDDGVGNTGSIMSALESSYVTGTPSAGVPQPDDATLYTVCMGV